MQKLWSGCSMPRGNEYKKKPSEFDLLYLIKSTSVVRFDFVIALKMRETSPALLLFFSEWQFQLIAVNKRGGGGGGWGATRKEM